MEGFNKLPKMAHFKEGGYVTKKELKAFEAKEDKAEEKKDVAEDKKIVKKAIAMHDAQEHKGEKTDLSKLKKGGRTKKEKGTVKKYCGGKQVKKMADGKLTGALPDDGTSFGAADADPLVRAEKARARQKAKLAASLTPDQLNQLLAAQKQSMAQQAAQAQQPQQPSQMAPQGRPGPIQGQ